MPGLQKKVTEYQRGMVTLSIALGNAVTSLPSVAETP